MIYSFICQDENNMGCGEVFEVCCSMDEIGMLKPQCPACDDFNSVRRNWSGEPKSSNLDYRTLGHLADQNADKFSDDYKQYLLDKYDNNPNKKKKKKKKNED